jgi:hypothetical protein
MNGTRKIAKSEHTRARFTCYDLTMGQSTPFSPNPGQKACPRPPALNGSSPHSDPNAHVCTASTSTRLHVPTSPCSTSTGQSSNRTIGTAARAPTRSSGSGGGSVCLRSSRSCTETGALSCRGLAMIIDIRRARRQQRYAIVFISNQNLRQTELQDWKKKIPLIANAVRCVLRRVSRPF